LVFLVAGFFACLQAGQGLGANAADALFFERFGVDNLPYMFLLLGTLALPVTLLYSAGWGRFPKGRFLVGLLWGAAAVLTLEWIALLRPAPSTYPLVWLSVSLLNAVVGTMVWNVAGEVSDTRQAKRLFSLFASAGILGSVLGNLATGPLARAAGTQNVLLAVVALLLVTTILVRALSRRYFNPVREASRPWLDHLALGFRTVRGSPLLRLVAVSSVLFSILFFSVSYPFSRSVATAGLSEAGMADFLGRFSSAVTGATFLVSLVLANRVFARMGVVSAVLLLPGLYVLGAALWLIRFDLLTASLVRFLQMVLIGGLAGTAFTSLFNASAPDQRGQALAFNAAVPAQLGVVLSGALLLVADRLLPGRRLYLVAIVMGMACLWLVLRMRSLYTRSLLASLRAGLFETVPSVAASPAYSAEAAQALFDALQDPRAPIRSAAAHFTAQLPRSAAVPALLRAAQDREAEVRIAAVRSLVRFEGEEVVEELRQHLADDAAQARAASLRYLLESGLAGKEVWQPLMTDTDPLVRAWAARGAWLAGEGPRAEAVWEALLVSTAAADRLAALEVIHATQHSGRLGDRSLPALLEDPRGRIRLLAASAIALQPAGETRLLEALETGISRAQAAILQSVVALSAAGRQRLRRWILGMLARLKSLDGWIVALAREGPVPPWAEPLARLLQARKRVLLGLVIEGVGGLTTPRAARLIARALVSADVGARAQALEALDSLVDRDLAGAILPLIEAPSSDRSAADATGVTRESSVDADPWIRAFALRARAEALEDEWDRVMSQALADSEEVVREAVSPAESGRKRGHAKEKPMAETFPTLGLLDRVLFLQQVPLFQDLPPEDLEPVARAAHERIFALGDLLCREGEQGDELYVLVDGEVAVEKESNGATRRLRDLRRGDHLGELAILRRQPRTASVRVVTDTCRALVLQGRDLEEILEERPNVARALLASLAYRLSTVS
jgi:HEAT repeat protein